MHNKRYVGRSVPNLGSTMSTSDRNPVALVHNLFSAFRVQGAQPSPFFHNCNYRLFNSTMFWVYVRELFRIPSRESQLSIRDRPTARGVPTSTSQFKEWRTFLDNIFSAQVDRQRDKWHFLLLGSIKNTSFTLHSSNHYTNKIVTLKKYFTSNRKLLKQKWLKQRLTRCNILRMFPKLSEPPGIR